MVTARQRIPLRDFLTAQVARTYQNGGATISFPASKFTSGTTQKVSMSSMTWKTLALTSSGSLEWVDHSAGGSDASILLKDQIAYVPTFTNESGNVQMSYSSSATSETLASATVQNTSGGLSTQPVKFAIACDAKDNVSSANLCVPSGATISEVGYTTKNGYNGYVASRAIRQQCQEPFRERNSKSMLRLETIWQVPTLL
jgi:hypothetical protein